MEYNHTLKYLQNLLFSVHKHLNRGLIDHFRDHTLMLNALELHASPIHQYQVLLIRHPLLQEDLYLLLLDLQHKNAIVMLYTNLL